MESVLNKPIILNLEPTMYSERARELLLPDFEYRELNDRRRLSEEVVQADGIITRLGFNIDKNFLKMTPKLSFIATATTGTNHIDNEYLTKVLGADLISLKGETDFLNKITPTAEHTWGLLLALVRHYKAAFFDVENYKWQRNNFLGSQLHGKTLGIIGLGRLGKMVANYGHAFGMNIMYTDIKEVKSTFKQVELTHLLKNSDVISIHAPFNESTRNLLSFKELEHVKPSCFLINTARGELVNSRAILRALELKKMAGAALDVVSGEVHWEGDIPIDCELINYAKKYQNLIITPHIGGACPDAMRLTEEFIARKIINKCKQVC